MMASTSLCMKKGVEGLGKSYSVMLCHDTFSIAKFFASDVRARDAIAADSRVCSLNFLLWLGEKEEEASGEAEQVIKQHKKTLVSKTTAPFAPHILLHSVRCSTMCIN